MTQIVMLLVVCLSAVPVVADTYVRSDIITQPTPERFSICYDHSCASVATLSVNKEEWRRAIAPLSRGAMNALDERAAIADAIAIFEEIIGEHLGTSDDRGGNLAGFGRPKQLDCIDESTNSSTYLRMLERDGLFRYHTVMDRSTRFGIFVGMPHTTAVIRENETGVRYAVDSWFFDNGQPPYIVDLKAWKSGEDPY
ncbi:MAG: hypothetical protein OEU91_11875 [Gammaproteobacteria bacterium]|nr:hypothetical protein [Gammaproteobacteria bacterium]